MHEFVQIISYQAAKDILLFKNSSGKKTCRQYHLLSLYNYTMEGWLTWIQNSATNPTLALLSRWHELKRVERERQKTCSILFPMGDDHVREIAM
ncbi:hypothetical protein NQ317_003834 [Molorchus minor]|uniref:Uncharacterized protein n=1 Tax=Molorchus minor TaxID=1323400 RepID=A0ABQ9JDN1_9CUCU|nr:hypothetical protein NQ317_003834 [Molorchus minor]